MLHNEILHVQEKNEIKTGKDWGAGSEKCILGTCLKSSLGKGGANLGIGNWSYSALKNISNLLFCFYRNLKQNVFVHLYNIQTYCKITFNNFASLYWFLILSICWFTFVVQIKRTCDWSRDWLCVKTVVSNRRHIM